MKNWMCVGLWLVSFGIVFLQPVHALGDAGKLKQIEEIIRSFEPKFPKVENISIADYLSKTKEKKHTIVLVDVRKADEFAVSHIPGAISKKEFESRQAQLKDAYIVTYCTIGYRSSQFAKRLNQAGYTAVNLRGSILYWCHAGQELNGPDGEATRRVHVYGPQWKLVPKGYEAIW